MAVAIKKMGFTKIIIYNGGLKDWKKSGLPLESIQPLPAYEGKFVSADELREKIAQADASGCVDHDGRPLLTLIDFRSSLKLSYRKGGDNYRIKTSCRTITALLDDFIDNPALINSVPKQGMVVTVSETGNRDIFLIRYLKKFGYTNIFGLEFGMRGWLKMNYPVEKISPSPSP